MSDSLFPPGHRHLHDPGGGDQENPQRRVRVLPLQPRTLVKKGYVALTACPPPNSQATRLALFATYAPERLVKGSMVFGQPHVTVPRSRPHIVLDIFTQETEKYHFLL